MELKMRTNIILLQLIALLQVVFLQNEQSLSTVAIQFTSLEYLDGKFADGTCCVQSCDPTKCQGNLIASFGPAGTTKDFGAVPVNCKSCTLDFAFYTTEYPLQSNFEYSWKLVDVSTGKLIDMFITSLLIYPYYTFGSSSMEGKFHRVKMGNYVKVLCLDRYGLFCKSHCTASPQTFCDAITAIPICQSGKFGPNCELTKRNCDSAPCKNGGICIDHVTYYDCACPEAYTGRHCETKSCDDGTCSHIKMCHNGVSCECAPYHTGENCATDECPVNYCGPYGRCQQEFQRHYCFCLTSRAHGNLCQYHCSVECPSDRKCEGASFISVCLLNVKRCSDPEPVKPVKDVTCKLIDPCHNGGFLTDITNPSTCKCPPYWLGKLCATPLCNVTNCQNGVCFENVGCLCALGFTGKNCDQPTCTGYDKCLNGGTCELTTIGIHTCTCNKEKYTGNFCQLTCPHSCVAGKGECDVNDGVIECRCYKGFAGDDCSEIARTDACQPNPCVHGICSIVGLPNSFVFSCLCDAKWTGKTCNQNSCSPATCIHGVCGSKVGCKCYEGYTGDNCEIVTEMVLSNLCQKNGFKSVVVEQYTFCDCDPAESIPPLCQVRCEKKCINGVCSIINGVPGCLCNIGFFGSLCERDQEFPDLHLQQIIYITLLVIFIALIIPIGVMIWYFKRKDIRIARKNKRFMHPTTLDTISPYGEPLQDTYGTSGAQFTIKPITLQK